MPVFALLTRLSPDALKGPRTIEELAHIAIKEVEENCPGIKWLANYATLGPYDYLDIFEASDEREAAKVATVIRSFGHATTETWTLVPWDRYKEAIAETR